MIFRKLRCSEISISCHITTLNGHFWPLATSFEAPIVAGETLYPSVEHHVAAQLLRDVQRLDAVRYVPLQVSRAQLRHYLRGALISVPLQEIKDWRRNRMYSALKAATELKLAQYPEMKDLLLQTGDSFLIEVANEIERSADGDDFDWSIGTTADSLMDWMRRESISPLALAFFTMHPNYKPDLIGFNMTGRLLVELRQQFMEIKQETEDDGVLLCPACKVINDSSISIPSTISEEIIILAGHSNPLTVDYPSTFVVEGRNYFNVEHFVKFKMLDDFGHSNSITNSLSDLALRKPTFFKSIADFLWDRRPATGDTPISTVSAYPSISALQRWAETRALELYETALNAKYVQNPHLLQALLASGDSLLVELRLGKGTRAKYEALEYGAFGQTDQWQAVDPAAFVKWVEKWKLSASSLHNLYAAMDTVDGPAVRFVPNMGKNRLGMLLMKIRNHLRASGLTSAAPSLHQFFADFLAQLLDTDSCRVPKAKTGLQRVNSFIVNVGDDHNGALISADGRCNPLSIFYLAPFTTEGLCFPTLEHYRWWKFFEHHSKFVQCVPGFWDHTDGRQLRAICEQWTSENLGLNGAALMERYKTDVEFDVLRNGALLKHSHNPHLLSVLFDGVSYGPIIAGETEGDASFGVGMTVAKVRRVVDKWKVSPQALTLWWTSLKCVKPANMGDNVYGLALMSARDELFAVYCERAVSTIPMAPSVKNFNEVTSEENYFDNDLDPERIFVFPIDHPCLGLNADVVIEGKWHESIALYLLHECFAAIGKGEDNISTIDLEQPGSVEMLLSRAEKVAEGEEVKDLYDRWFDSPAATETLTKAVESKAKDGSFRQLLLSTGKALLISVITSGAIDPESKACSAESFFQRMTVGLREEELTDFLRDLRPPATDVLQFWMRSDAILRGQLGSNLWAACLMAARKTINAAESNDSVAMDDPCFWTLDSIPDRPANCEKQPAKKRTAIPGKEWIETKTESDTLPSKLISDDYQVATETEREVFGLPLLPDLLASIPDGHTNESDTDASVQAIAEAMRLCGPLYDRVISSTRSPQQIKEFGERIGRQIVSMFGGCVPDLASFTDEDLYNLGRIAACQVSRPQ